MTVRALRRPAAGTIAAALLFSASVGPAAAGTYVVWGVGSKTCGAWTDARRTNGEMLGALRSWVHAFVTGAAFAREGLALRKDARIEPEALTEWVDAWCDANPRMTVERAAVALLDHVAETPAK